MEDSYRFCEEFHLVTMCFLSEYQDTSQKNQRGSYGRQP